MGTGGLEVLLPLLPTAVAPDADGATMYCDSDTSEEHGNSWGVKARTGPW